MTDGQQERLKQIRYRADVNLLLSLVDEQAKPDCRPDMIAINREDAATRMRSACVEKVKSMADGWLKSAITEADGERSSKLRMSYNVAQNLITELESVALQEQERCLKAIAIDQCLRQVRTMQVNWEDGMRWPHQGDLLDEVISRLESLTLDQVKQEKHGA